MRTVVGKPHLSYSTLDSGRIVLWATCPFCGLMNGGDVEKAWEGLTIEGLQRWLKTDELIQVVFPKASADTREQLKTGICPTCWNKTMGEEE